MNLFVKITASFLILNLESFYISVDLEFSAGELEVLRKREGSTLVLYLSPLFGL